MVYLNRVQKRLLKRISKCKQMDCSNLSENDLNIVRYLDDLGFVTSNRKITNGFDRLSQEITPCYGDYISVEISEKGKSYFAEIHAERMHFLIPVTISICALVISILSLLAKLPICQLLQN